MVQDIPNNDWIIVLLAFLLLIFILVGTVERNGHNLNFIAHMTTNC